MLYWKTFLTICLITWFITLGIIAIIVLGLFGIVVMNPVFWVMTAILLVAFFMASMICKFMLQAELKERREERDNSRSLGES